MILISLPIAACTLAAGIAAGLADRKRPFSLLRLTGARLATLRSVVALEGTVPLLSVAVVAIGTGFGAAAMYASEAQNRTMVAPGASYYILTGAGIVISLGIIALTFPLLSRLTGPEVAERLGTIRAAGQSSPRLISGCQLPAIVPRFSCPRQLRASTGQPIG